jgi:hypothetical protein
VVARLQENAPGRRARRKIKIGPVFWVGTVLANWDKWRSSGDETSRLAPPRVCDNGFSYAEYALRMNAECVPASGAREHKAPRVPWGGVIKTSHEWSLVGSTRNSSFVTAECYLLDKLLLSIAMRCIRPQSVHISDICHRGRTLSFAGTPSHYIGTHPLHMCETKLADPNMQRACTEVPGILVRNEDRYNPCGRRYQMMDGIHRICRFRGLLARAQPVQ